MKRVLSIFIVICFMFLFSITGFAEGERQITVFVDEKKIDFDVNPVIENDRVLVPARFIFEALGAKVSWDDDTKTATAVKGKITVKVPIDKMYTHILKNNETIILDVPPRIDNGRILVPLRAVSEGMEAAVEWVDETSQVIITTKITDGPLKYTELSQSDMEKLKSGSDNLMHMFEFSFLLDAVLENDSLSSKILEKDEATLDFVKNEWNKTVVKKIIEIQDSSSSIYERELNSYEASDYLAIAKQAELDAETVFYPGEYIDIADSTTMLFYEYKRPGAEVTSYIALVAAPGKDIRAFGAAYAGTENRYFIEITDTDVLNWGPVANKEKFIENVILRLNGETNPNVFR